MKVYYVYLNTYKNGYMYVGLHAWNGPLGELDPNYHGSSSVAKRYNWLPIKEEILESFPVKRTDREKYWIIYYCNMYGIADVVKSCLHVSNLLSSFRSHGLMLNGHANEPPHDKASMLKRVETQRKNGTFGDMHQCHSKESMKKSLKTRIDSGIQKEIILKAQRASLTKKARMQRAHTLLLKGESKFIRITFPDGRILEGILRKTCEEVGYGSIRNKLSKELCVVKDSIKFEVIEYDGRYGRN